MSLLLDRILSVASSTGSAIAIEENGRQTCYAELAALIDTAAQRLCTGSPIAGQRVALFAASTTRFVADYFGALKAGAVPVLFDTRMPRAIAAQVMQKHAIRSLDDGATGVSGAEARRPVREHTETCRLTSGTTGLPKVLEFSGKTVVAAGTTWSQATGQQPTDRVLCLAPLANGLGFNVALIPTLLSGGTLMLCSGVQTPASVCRRIHNSHASRLVAVPAFYNLLAKNVAAADSIRGTLDLAVSAAAPLDAAVRRRFREITGARLVDYYGIAETGPVTFEWDEARDEGLGTALPGASLKLSSAGDGELLVSTGWMTSGYLDDPHAFQGRVDPDGHFHTRDVATLVDGRLRVGGRLDSLVNIAGTKFDPEKVAVVIRDMEQVRDAHSMAESNDSGETELVVFVVADEAVTRRELVTHCRGRLPDYMVPTRVHFVREIPRNGVGKPILAEIRTLKRSEHGNFASGLR